MNTPLIDRGRTFAFMQRWPVPEERVAMRRDTALYLDGLTVSFDGFKALDDLSLAIDRGELRCIIGANGAGKTTMMDVITGRTRADRGRAIFGDRLNLLALDEAAVAAAGIGRKFQQPTVFENHTLLANLELAAAGPRSPRALLTATLGGEQRDRVDEVLTLTGLGERRRERAGALSHGEKQWLEIGMLLMQNPTLLLIDEPVAGMTGRETERTAELLTGLAGRHSVVVVEHDMAFIRSIARKVTVLHQGRVLAEGSMDGVQNNPDVIRVYLGE